MTPARATSLLATLFVGACVTDPAPKTGPFELDLQTPELAFITDVNQCVEQPIEVSNAGDRPGKVSVHAPTWDCDDPGVFRVGAGSVTLPAGGSATLSVTYCPSADGTCNAVVPLSWSSSAGAAGTTEVALTGVGISPDDDLDGYTVSDGDCLDTDPTVHPDADESANDIDDDCDGTIDEGTEAYDDDGDGWTELQGDCDDADPHRSPGEPEVVDDEDQDCDGVVDNGTEVYDDDGDGYSEAEGDCVDTNPDRSPGAPETPDGVDNDCDGVVDDGTRAYDDDGDGVTEDGGDCDDTNPAVHPGAPETPDGEDRNCNGVVDDNTVVYDDDGDGWAEVDGDCNDYNADVSPGGEELANGMDDDCDGTVDEGTTAYDDDGDGMTEDAGDCDDGDPTVWPGATEVADGVDDDCDGVIDEGTTVYDDDGDGFSEDDGDCDDTNSDVGPDRPDDDTNGIDDDCDGLIDELDPPSVGLDEMSSADQAAAYASFGFAGADYGVDTLLEEIDWRDVYGENYITAVEDQGNCGSCTLFAGSGAIEGSLTIQADVATSLDLSEAWPAACASSLDYCGNFLDDYSDQVLGVGMVNESDLLYSDDCSWSSGSCNDNSALTCSGSASYFLADYHYVAAGDEDGAKAALHLGPILVSMSVYSDISTATEVSAYEPGASAVHRGYHAVVVVGYDDEGWLVKNSWGTRAHSSGYFKLAFGASDVLFQGAFLYEVQGGDLTAGLSKLNYGNIADVADLPNGTVCGLTHTRNGGSLCEGHDAQTSCPTGYTQRAGGDWGLSSGEGFYWCEVTSGTDSPDVSGLPDGTVCGLEHATNGPVAADCMGYDATAGSCPSGWTAMYGGDDGAAAGQGFYWCELTSGCEDASCLSTGQSGLACGLGYDTESHGRCLSESPVETEACPTGTTYHALGDWGRGSGECYAACSTDG